MNDQLILREAVRALQTCETEHDLAESTEQRVLFTLRRRAQRWRAIRGAAYGLAFSLCAAASAHAAILGPAQTWRVMEQLWRSEPSQVARPKGPFPTPAQHATVARVRRASGESAARVEARRPAREQEAVEIAPQSPSAAALPRSSAPTRSGRRVRARSAAHIASDQVRAPAPPAPPTAEALYSEAHQLHFVTGDKYAALRAWDAYLAAAPDGTFAPEAHYNRAVCLVALGRTDAALLALRAIVAGEVATYRARDAARLLRALDRQ